MNSNMAVMYKGEEHIVPAAGLGDMVRFERQFGVPAQVFDADDPTPLKLEWIAYLVYLGLKRRGVVEGGFDDEFLDNVEDIGLVADEKDDTDDTEGSGPLDQPISSLQP